jgi:hypothetical protein
MGEPVGKWPLGRLRMDVKIKLKWILWKYIVKDMKQIRIV